MTQSWTLSVSNPVLLMDREAFEADLRAWGIDPAQLIYSGPQPLPTGTVRLSTAQNWPEMDDWAAADRLGVDAETVRDMDLPHHGEIHDLAGLLALHLAEGEVAVLTTSKITADVYAGGQSVAVNAQGERVEMDLSEIHEKARALHSNALLPRW